MSRRRRRKHIMEVVESQNREAAVAQVPEQLPLTPEAEAQLRRMWEAIIEVPVTLLKIPGEDLLSDAQELDAWRAATDRGIEVLYL